MFKYKAFIPLALNILFSILCVTYLQVKGQQYYLLSTEIILIVLSLFIGIVVQLNMCPPNIANVDHSPMCFTILLLVEFGSLMSMNDQRKSENLICLLIGSVLGLQKIEFKDKEQTKRYWNIKATGHAITLLLIFIVIIFNQVEENFDGIVIASLLVLVVYIQDLFLNNQKKLIEQKEIEVVTVNQMTKSIQQSQGNSNNIYGLWEKLLEQQIFFVTSRNNDIFVEKMSSSLLQLLKDKNQTIEELLKKIQICSISLESENILTNNMIEVKTTLAQYLKEQFSEEKMSAAQRRRRSQKEFLEDPQQKLISPNESRSRLQSFQRNEGLQKGNTLQLNNSSVQYISDKEWLSASVKELLTNLNNRYDSNQSVNKRQVFYGYMQNDEISQILVKLTIICHQEKSQQTYGYLVEIEEQQNQIKQFLSNVSYSYKQEVTQKQCKLISKMIDTLQQKFNNYVSPSLKENQLLGQVSTQIYILDIWNCNFIYFLTEDLPPIKADQFNVKGFLNSIRNKFKLDGIVTQKSINISINDDLLQNKLITTDVKLLRQIIVNLLVNAIQAYSKPDITNIIQINVSETLTDDIQFEILDKAGGFQSQLDFKRVRDGKLGIYIVLKLLPYLSKQPKLEYRTVAFENQVKGCLVKFLLPRNANQTHGSQNNLYQFEPNKLAQLQQSQQFNYNQYNI